MFLLCVQEAKSQMLQIQDHNTRLKKIFKGRKCNMNRFIFPV